MSSMDQARKQRKLAQPMRPAQDNSAAGPSQQPLLPPYRHYGLPSVADLQQPAFQYPHQMPIDAALHSATRPMPLPIQTTVATSMVGHSYPRASAGGAQYVLSETQLSELVNSVTNATTKAFQESFKQFRAESIASTNALTTRIETVETKLEEGRLESKNLHNGLRQFFNLQAKSNADWENRLTQLQKTIGKGEENDGRSIMTRLDAMEYTVGDIWERAKDPQADAPRRTPVPARLYRETASSPIKRPPVERAVSHQPSRMSTPIEASVMSRTDQSMSTTLTVEEGQVNLGKHVEKLFGSPQPLVSRARSSSSRDEDIEMELEYPVDAASELSQEQPTVELPSCSLNSSPIRSSRTPCKEGTFSNWDEERDRDNLEDEEDSAPDSPLPNFKPDLSPETLNKAVSYTSDAPESAVAPLQPETLGEASFMENDAMVTSTPRTVHIPLVAPPDALPMDVPATSLSARGEMDGESHPKQSVERVAVSDQEDEDERQNDQVSMDVAPIKDMEQDTKDEQRQEQVSMDIASIQNTEETTAVPAKSGQSTVEGRAVEDLDQDAAMLEPLILQPSAVDSITVSEGDSIQEESGPISTGEQPAVPTPAYVDVEIPSAEPELTSTPEVKHNHSAAEQPLFLPASDTESVLEHETFVDHIVEGSMAKSGTRGPTPALQSDVEHDTDDEDELAKAVWMSFMPPSSPVKLTSSPVKNAAISTSPVKDSLSTPRRKAKNPDHPNSVFGSSSSDLANVNDLLVEPSSPIEPSDVDEDEYATAVWMSMLPPSSPVKPSPQPEPSSMATPKAQAKSTLHPASAHNSESEGEGLEDMTSPQDMGSDHEMEGISEEEEEHFEEDGHLDTEEEHLDEGEEHPDEEEDHLDEEDDHFEQEDMHLDEEEDQPDEEAEHLEEAETGIQFDMSRDVTPIPRNTRSSGSPEIPLPESFSFPFSPSRLSASPAKFNNIRSLSPVKQRLRADGSPPPSMKAAVLSLRINTPSKRVNDFNKNSFPKLSGSSSPSKTAPRPAVPRSEHSGTGSDSEESESEEVEAPVLPMKVSGVQGAYATDDEVDEDNHPDSKESPFLRNPLYNDGEERADSEEEERNEVQEGDELEDDEEDEEQELTVTSFPKLVHSPSPVQEHIVDQTTPARSPAFRPSKTPDPSLKTEAVSPNKPLNSQTSGPVAIKTENAPITPRKSQAVPTEVIEILSSPEASPRTAVQKVIRNSNLKRMARRPRVSIGSASTSARPPPPVNEDGVIDLTLSTSESEAGKPDSKSDSDGDNSNSDSDSDSDMDSDTSTEIIRPKRALLGSQPTGPKKSLNLKDRVRSGPSLAATRIKKRKPTPDDEDDTANRPLKRARESLKMKSDKGKAPSGRQENDNIAVKREQTKESLSQLGGSSQVMKVKKRSASPSRTGSTQISHRKLREKSKEVVWPPPNRHGSNKFQREFIECDDCKAWYHYGCVNIEVNDIRIEDDDTLFSCPPCVAMGKASTRSEMSPGFPSDNRNPIRLTAFPPLDALRAIPTSSGTCARPDCTQRRKRGEYFVEGVIGRMPGPTKKGFLWLLKWDGYPISRATWQGEEDMQDPAKLIEEFNVAAKSEGLDLSNPFAMLVLEKARPWHAMKK